MMSSDQNNEKNEKSQTNMIGAGLAIGVGVGLAIGSAMGNPGAGLAIGIALGSAAPTALQNKKNSEYSDPSIKYHIADD